MPDTPTVCVGQVWEDCDKRSAGRRIIVIKVGDTHAIVEPYPPVAQGARPPRRTRIRLTRFRPTSNGYRFVRGPEEPDERHPH